MAQTPGVTLAEWAATGNLIESLVQVAAGQQADLVVLPECAWPAYFLGSRRDYFAARAAGLPAPTDFLLRLSRLARDLHIAICCGHVEEHGGRLCNTATLLGPDGRVLGRHRKCFLWAFDHDVFDPGDALLPCDTPFGRVGLMVCADARLPEIPATLAARGAELLLQPTAWVNAGPAGTLWNPQPEFLISARAAEFGVPIVSASKWGREGQTEFVGSSLICDARGQVLARCPAEGTQLVLAEVSPGRPRPARLTATERVTLNRPGAAVIAPGAPTRAAMVFSRLELTAAQLQELTKRASAALDAPAALLPVSRPPVCVFTPAANDQPLEGAASWAAAVDALEMSRFACPRSLAADGVLLLLAHAASLDVPLTLARACENRIYIASVTPKQAALVSPAGRVLHQVEFGRAGAAESQLVIDLDQARCKLVADRTEVFAGRRPEQYRL